MGRTRKSRGPKGQQKRATKAASVVPAKTHHGRQFALIAGFVAVVGSPIVAQWAGAMATVAQPWIATLAQPARTTEVAAREPQRVSPEVWDADSVGSRPPADHQTRPPSAGANTAPDPPAPYSSGHWFTAVPVYGKGVSYDFTDMPPNRPISYEDFGGHIFTS